MGRSVSPCRMLPESQVFGKPSSVCAASPTGSWSCRKLKRRTLCQGFGSIMAGENQAGRQGSMRRHVKNVRWPTHIAVLMLVVATLVGCSERATENQAPPTRTSESAPLATQPPVAVATQPAPTVAAPRGQEPQTPPAAPATTAPVASATRPEPVATPEPTPMPEAVTEPASRPALGTVRLALSPSRTACRPRSSSPTQMTTVAGYSSSRRRAPFDCWWAGECSTHPSWTWQTGSPAPGTSRACWAWPFRPTSQPAATFS